MEEMQMDKNFTNEELDVFLNEIRLLVDDYLERAKLHALSAIKSQLINTPVFNVDGQITSVTNASSNGTIAVRGKRGRGRPKKTS